jgi:hypothetical protein
LPIEQSTLLRGANFSGGLKFALTERGREVGRLAWVPRKVVPYIGAGGGAMWFQVRQNGDFVDYVDLSVFTDVFESSGWAPTAHAFGGVDVRVLRRAYVTVRRAVYVGLGQSWTGLDRLRSDRSLRIAALRRLQLHHLGGPMKTLASGVALLLLAVPAHAQNATDARWTRWTGCWELVTENSREGAPSPETAGRTPRSQPRDPARPQVCVEASPTGGATFTTRVGTQTPIVQTVIADGTDRPVTEDGCSGTQRAEWSADGLRLFARAELTCKGDQGTRRVSGLAMLGPQRQVDRCPVGRYRRTRELPRPPISPRRRQPGCAWYRSHVTDARRCEGSEREGLATRA